VVAIYGSDRSAQLLALNLSLAGAKGLCLADRRPVTLADSTGALLTAADVGKPFAHALWTRIKEVLFLSQSHAHELTPLTNAEMCVATESFPPEVESELMRSGRPHLITETLGNSITVGPLVIPGRTGCLRCHRLRQRDDDENALEIARGRYLAHFNERAPLPLVQLAASMHALAIQEFFRDPERVHPLHNTVLTVTSELEISSKSFRPHPRCGCTWNQAEKP
jgi:hypothetical protein